jgi:hypothetical protein
MFCETVTRKYSKGSDTYKTIPRLEITLRLLKNPLAIFLTPLFLETIAVLASHERPTY